MAAPSFTLTFKGYLNLWKRATLTDTKEAEAAKVANKIISYRQHYEPVAARFGNPKIWPLIGAIHQREANLSFSGVLHNGEHIIGTGRKTSLVPRGRGPFSTWENAAVDALAIKGWDKITDWPIERWLYEAERYNGWGYYLYHKENSPYVWAGTSLQQRGKYVSDGAFSSSTWDTQLGIAAILKAVFKADPSLEPHATPTSVVPAIVAAGTAAGAAVITPNIAGSLDPACIIGAGVALAIIFVPWIKDTLENIKGASDMDGSKTWTSSLGVWGGILAAAAPMVGAAFGYTVTPDDAAQIGAVVGGLASSIGGILAVVGRIRATKVITKPVA